MFIRGKKEKDCCFAPGERSSRKIFLKRRTRTLGKRATLISLVYGVAFCLINTPVVNYPCTTFRVLPVPLSSPVPAPSFLPVALPVYRHFILLPPFRSIPSLPSLVLPPLFVPFVRPLIHSIGICLLKNPRSRVSSLKSNEQTKKRRDAGGHSFKSGPPTSPRSPFFLSPPLFFPPPPFPDVAFIFFVSFHFFFLNSFPSFLHRGTRTNEHVRSFVGYSFQRNQTRSRARSALARGIG